METLRGQSLSERMCWSGVHREVVLHQRSAWNRTACQGAPSDTRRGSLWDRIAVKNGSEKPGGLAHQSRSRWPRLIMGSAHSDVEHRMLVSRIIRIVCRPSKLALCAHAAACVHETHTSTAHVTPSIRA